MSSGEDNGYKVNSCKAVKISLADPRKIREMSKGEVKKAETINYRSSHPEKDGLFCEKIFGPERDYECSCGRYKGMKYKGLTCDRCGVKITRSTVRRSRMGHIELAAPVVHVWFFKNNSSKLANLLSMKAAELDRVIYYQNYVVTEPGETPYKLGEVFDEDKYRKAKEEYPDSGLKAEMGAEAVRKLLNKLDIVELSKKLREEFKASKSKQTKKELTARLELVEMLKNCPNENNPAWMVLDVIPVIPPDLRPLVLLETQTYATSDLNDLYRRIINRNNRLKKLVDLNAPEVIIRNEKRMLQQSVDALFDNGRCKRPMMGPSNRPLKSLTDMIKGKQGRFRENLLGKRVDYSARSVIVVGPTMRLYQCGLPRKIALELYQPFIIRELKEKQKIDTIKSAKKALERRDDEVWEILEEVIKNHPVLLNRAPTLHRMGIQAFEPVLVEGNAIKLHPLACKGFNADFDGDQMAVHLPLSLEAQVEAHTLMLSTNNIFSPANGKPIISPSQDIVMGCYYMTMELPNLKGEGMTFASKEEVLLAYAHKKVALQAKIKVRMEKGRFIKAPDDQKENSENREEKILVHEGEVFETTPGRLLFNEIVPSGMPYYNMTMRNKELALVIKDCNEYFGRKETVDLLDKMMRLGFEESTKSGLSFATDDLVTPAEKRDFLEQGDREVQKLQEQMYDELMTEEECRRKTIDVWSKVNDQITEKMMDVFKDDTPQNNPKRFHGYGKAADSDQSAKTDLSTALVSYVNPIYLMSQSGARGGREQIRQLAGMRGLMARPNGEIIETPVKANFREGLNVLEYFSSTHGARKGLADTALKTASSGYLTRKLVDVSQNCVVTKRDCGTTKGILKGATYDENGKQVVSFIESIVGRVACDNIVSIKDDTLVVEKNQLITPEVARKIKEVMGEDAKIRVRSPLTCEAGLGVCALCYGMDLSTSKLVEEGLAVGTIAAQSVGEPGTQLTMRTFHIGGTASHTAEQSEITSRQYKGYIRFEKMEIVRNGDEPGLVLSCKPGGGISIYDDKECKKRWETFEVPEGAVLKVFEDDFVEENTALCTFDPHSKPILAKFDGVINYVNLIEGDTVLVSRDEATKNVSRIVSDIKGDRHPHLSVKSAEGKILEDYYLPGKTQIVVEDGAEVTRGMVLAKMPRSTTGNNDITSGLPRVTEIFEARKPKDPAVLSEIDGVIEIGEEKHKKVQVHVTNKETGKEQVHEVAIGKHNLIVHTGDEVKAGQPLTDGIVTPSDILRISGEIEIQEYLTREVQKVYRQQGVEINDKHIEIIISQMLRKVKVKKPGDTNLLQGEQIERYEFNRKNKNLENCVKIVEPNDTDFQPGDIVQKKVFEEKNAEFEAEGGKPATATKPEKAVAETLLLGISKAAVQSPSFISSASFQETTKVLSEAALGHRVDNLVGLKENVILGHLIPAGTGFRKYQKADWRYRPEAVANMPVKTEADSYDNTLLRPEEDVESIASFDAVPDEKPEEE